MPLPFCLTEDATSDLEETVAFIARNNPAAALKLAEDLEHTFLFLSEWPGAGHKRSDLTSHPEARFWTHASRLIVYLPARAPLLIVAVLYASQNAQSILQSRLEQL